MLFARLDVAVAPLLHLVLLNEVDICLHYCLLICIVLLCFCPKPSLRSLLHNPPTSIRPTRAALCNSRPPRCCIRNHLSDILPPCHGGASELLARACGEFSAFFSSSTSTATGFMLGYISATEFPTGREESLAGVPFPCKLLMFFAELVPEDMESFVVRPVDDVAELV